MNFVVLASGRGGNLQAIIEAVGTGKITADLKVVISDKKDAFALERARQANIPAVYINPKDFADRETFDRVVIEKLREFKIDFVVLAGYMRILSNFFVEQFPNKILNIHPSLLPAFKGAHAMKDAFEQSIAAKGNLSVTGATVHIVIPELDAGPIILQEQVKIDPKDTLESMEEKIHAIEHRIYPQAIDLFAQGKLRIKGQRVLQIKP